MIGDDLDWPAVVPTKAVLETLSHVAAHAHEDVNPVQHFLAVLREELGLQERGPGKMT